MEANHAWMKTAENGRRVVLNRSETASGCVYRDGHGAVTDFRGSAVERRGKL